MVRYFLSFILLWAMPLVAELDPFEREIAMGNDSTGIEVFVFTDWGCGACKFLEPTLEKMAPVIMKKGALLFVDIPIHPITNSYTPFNLSLLINDKNQYIDARRALDKLSLKNPSPSFADVKKELEPVGIHFKELDYSQVQKGIDYFTKYRKQFGVDRTPTLVIYNAKSGKSEKLIGSNEITEKKVIETIDKLK
jgi:hypothetical protein